MHFIKETPGNPGKWHPLDAIRPLKTILILICEQRVNHGWRFLRGFIWVGFSVYHLQLVFVKELDRSAMR